MTNMKNILLYLWSMRRDSYSVTTFVLGLISVILLILVAYNYRQLMNPDGVAYMSIAEQYASGYFRDAVNAYWSPLLSWLMTPLVLVGFSPQISFTFVNLAAAILVLGLGVVFLYRYVPRTVIALIFYFGLMTPFLMHALTVFIVPDLLVVAWVGMFVLACTWIDVYIMKKDVSFKQYVIAGAILGVIGVLGYFTKMFLLPFFVAAVAGWLIWRTIEYKGAANFFSKVVLKRLFTLPAIGAVVFMMLASPWLIVLAKKYGEFTLGSSTSFNFSARSPEFSGNPIRQGLAPPPTEHAVTAWEDPTLLEYVRFSPVSDSNSLAYYISQRLEVLPENIETVMSVSPVILTVLIVVIVAFAAGWVTYRRNTALAVSLVSLLVYWGGYYLIASKNQRYFWPLFFLAVVVGAYFLARVWGNINGRVSRAVIVLLCLGLSLLTITTHKVAETVAAKFEEPWFAMSEQITTIKSGERIASNDFLATTHLAYYLEAKSYGTIGDEAEYDDVVVQESLDAHGIEKFIYLTPWSDGELNQTLTRGESILEAVRGLEPWRCGPTAIECHLYVLQRVTD